MALRQQFVSPEAVKSFLNEVTKQEAVEPWTSHTVQGRLVGYSSITNFQWVRNRHDLSAAQFKTAGHARLNLLNTVGGGIIACASPIGRIQARYTIFGNMMAEDHAQEELSPADCTYTYE
eukprot:GHVU01227540.1.p1 GENE.GHVU01227540.1~~GHVU01227540.1.p1  ORF type:complete len:120 (+),score=10.41 GHVU01227540.1:347-706(+)